MGIQTLATTGTTTNISLSPHLSAILGFGDELLDSNPLVAPTVADPFTGHKYFCIYSEIVENSYFRDVLAPLLAVIPVTTTASEILLQYEPTHPQYIKVNRLIIDSIRVLITSEVGAQFSWKQKSVHPVLITLHIRKRST